MKVFESLPVFRLYNYVIRKNLSMVIMYFVIFTILVISFGNTAQQEGDRAFTAAETLIAVTDNDGSVLSKGIIEYLEKKNEVTLVDYDKDSMVSRFYYQETGYYLMIPAGYCDDFINAFEEGSDVPALDAVKYAKSASGYYIDGELSQFLIRIKMYLAGGFEMEEAVTRALELPDGLEKISIAEGELVARPMHTYSLRYLPYLYIAALIYCVAFVFRTFRDRNISLKINASPVSPVSQMLQAMLSFTILFAAFFVASLFISVPVSGLNLFRSEFFHLHFVNALLLFFFSAAIAFLVGNFAKSDQAIAAIANVISLGVSFLCGVFVPIKYLGDSVTKVSRFIPVYWYETVNDLLSTKAALSPSDLTLIRQAFLIEGAAAFAVVCLTLFLVRERRA